MIGRRWGLLLALVAIMGVVSFRVGGYTAEYAKLKRAEGIAMAYKNAEADSIVARVEGEPITKGEFLAAYASAQSNKEVLEQEEVGQFGQGAKERKDKMLNLLQKYSPDTIALAKVLVDTTVYHEATKRGLAKTEEEVNNYIKTTREALKGARVPELERTIEILGEDYYWNNVAPKIYRKLLTIGAFKGEVLRNQNLGNLTVAYRVWASYKYQLAKQAQLEIIDRALISSTKQEALSYL